jgi:hypothetical protein
MGFSGFSPDVAKIDRESHIVTTIIQIKSAGVIALLLAGRRRDSQAGQPITTPGEYP